MSTSVAPSATATRVCSALEVVLLAPRGKSMTVHTATVVPAS